MNRRSRLPRHSKSLLPNLRIPRPLCTWGWPKTSSSSQRARRHSTLSLFGNARRRRMTVGSTARSLLKQLPKLLRRRRCKLFTSLQSPIALFGGFFQCSHPLGRGAVFSLGVVGRLDVDFAKGDNVGAAYDSNIVAARRSGQPTPQIL